LIIGGGEVFADGEEGVTVAVVALVEVQVVCVGKQFAKVPIVKAMQLTDVGLGIATNGWWDGFEDGPFIAFGIYFEKVDKVNARIGESAFDGSDGELEFIIGIGTDAMERTSAETFWVAGEMVGECARYIGKTNGMDGDVAVVTLDIAAEQFDILWQWFETVDLRVGIDSSKVERSNADVRANVEDDFWLNGFGQLIHARVGEQHIDQVQIGGVVSDGGEPVAAGKVDGQFEQCVLTKVIGLENAHGGDAVAIYQAAGNTFKSGGKAMCMHEVCID